MARSTSVLSLGERRASSSALDLETTLIEEEVFELLYPISEFKDGFASLNTAANGWPNNYGTVDASGGRGRVACTTTYSGMVTSDRYSFDSVFAEVYPAALNGATTDCYSAMWIRSRTGTAAGTQIGFYLSRITGLLWFANQVDYYDSAEVTITYDETQHRWWKIFLSGTTVTWQTSPDGIAWTTRRTAAAPTWAGNEQQVLWFESHRGEGTNNYFEFDNINIAPSLLTAGSYPAGAIAGDATLAIDGAGAVDPLPVITATGKAALAVSSATSDVATPIITGTGKSALAASGATADIAVPVITGTGRAASALSGSTASSAAPVIAGAGKAILAVNGAATATAYPATVQTGSAALNLNATTLPPETLFNHAAISGDPDFPALNISEEQGVNLGVTVRFTLPGRITQGHFRYMNDPQTERYNFQIYEITNGDFGTSGGSPTGTPLVAGTTGIDFPSSPVANTWDTVDLPSEITVDTSKTYRIRTWTQDGRYTATGAFYNSDWVNDGGHIIGLATGTALDSGNSALGSLRNGTFSISASPGYPSSTFNANGYFMDITFIPDGDPSSQNLNTGSFPIQVVAGDAALVYSGETATDPVVPAVIGGRWVLAANGAANVQPQSLVVIAGNAALAANQATAWKPQTAPVGFSKAVGAANHATTAYSAPTAVSGGLVGLLYDKADAMRGVPVILGGYGASEIEILEPDAVSIDLDAGAFPLAVIGGRWALVRNFATPVNAMPTLITGAGIAKVGNNATAVKAAPISVVPVTTQTAISLAAVVSNFPAILTAPQVFAAGDLEVAMRGAVILSGISSRVAGEVSLAAQVVAVPIIGSPGKFESVIISGPGLTYWNGTTEQPLILVGVWDGTQIVPATLDTVI